MKTPQYQKNGKGTGHRYPKEYAERVCDWVLRYQKRMPGGHPLAEASKHFNIPYETIRRWTALSSKRKVGKPIKSKQGVLLSNMQKEFARATKAWEKIVRMIG